MAVGSSVGGSARALAEQTVEPGGRGKGEEERGRAGQEQGGQEEGGGARAKGVGGSWGQGWEPGARFGGEGEEAEVEVDGGSAATEPPAIAIWVELRGGWIAEVRLVLRDVEAVTDELNHFRGFRSANMGEVLRGLIYN